MLRQPMTNRTMELKQSRGENEQMARAFKCDRCGNYFDWKSGKMSGFAFLAYDPIRGRYSIEREKYDLCPKCVQDLKEWNL